MTEVGHVAKIKLELSIVIEVSSHTKQLLLRGNDAEFESLQDGLKRKLNAKSVVILDVIE